MEIALCKKSETIPDGSNWIFEQKYDGARCIVMDGDLYNRDEDQVGTKVTEKFPEIDPPEDVILDGEIVSSAGFGAVVGRQHTSSDFKIKMKSRSCPATLMVFDVLARKGEDLRSLDLRLRKQELDYMDLSEYDRVRKAIFTREGEKLWETAIEEDWEGIVAKREDSTYPEGRSSNWLKIKNFNEDYFPIVNWEETEEGGFVVHIPVDDGTQRIVVNNKEAQTEIKESDEELEAEIRYLEKGNNNRLRHIGFKGFRRR